MRNFARSFNKAGVCVCIAALAAAISCSSPAPSGSKEVEFAGQAAGEKVTEAQLQDSLFRFANRFASDVNDALKGFDNSPNAALRDQALLRRLIYNSSALDIVLGPTPQANLLDMVAFIELTRAVWNDYWVPRVFKEQGDSMTQYFNRASEEIWKIASSVSNEEQRNELKHLIKRWLEKNPNRVAVENVRLSAFSGEAGASAQEMQKEVGGLMAGIQRATQVGDRALLFSERALFYAQRAPFLWRLQAQAGTREVLIEAEKTLSSGKGIIEQAPQIRSLLNDMSETLASLTQTIVIASEHPDTLKAGTTSLSHLADVLTEWNRTLSSPQYKETLSRLSGLSGSIESHENRFLVKLLIVGASLIFLFGLVSLISRLAFLRLSRRRSTRLRRERKLKAA